MLVLASAGRMSTARTTASNDIVVRCSASQARHVGLHNNAEQIAAEIETDHNWQG